MKITFVGGGSFAWTPNIVRDVILTPALRDSEIVLYDIVRKNSDLTKAFCEKLARAANAPARFVSTDDPAKALDGADYIVITISTGGLEAMAHDLAIPEDYGIYHTVGDTCGPGGWARTIRNFDTFVTLAEQFNRYAPGAVVLNYTNPMITLTDVLSRLCDGPVIGLCHGLFENLYFIKDFYRLESEEQIAAQYAGINHFFWITQARAGKTDVIADLSRRLKKQSFSDLFHTRHMDPMGHHSKYREVATDLFRQTGVMPYIGDRHTCEWFPRYITSRENMKKYKIIRTSIKDRFKMRDASKKRLERMVRQQLPPDYLKRSRETAADIIEAHSQGKVFIDVGNMPNIGQVANLPLGAVVETAVRVDRNGFSPIAFGALPEPVQQIVEPWCNVLSMLTDACFAGDRTLAMQALRQDPTCAHLTNDQVNEMGARLLKAHRKFVTAF